MSATTVGATSAPERTCVGCRRTRPKHDLVRLVRRDADVLVDLGAVRPGRGAYVCPDVACVDAARLRGARSLRRALPGGTAAAALLALDAVRSAASR